MGKRIVSLVLLLMFNAQIFSLSFNKETLYESHLDAKLDLGVTERKFTTVFGFLDQIAFDSLEKHQELMYQTIILDSYDDCKGNYNRFIRKIKSAHRAVSSIFKRLKKAGDKDLEPVKIRQKQLNGLLSAVRKKRSFVRMLWTCAEIEKRYGKIIESYKLNIEAADQKREFEKEILYTTFDLGFSRAERPVYYFMSWYLNKDIKKYKRKYASIVNNFEFSTVLLEKQYKKLILIKSAIEDLEIYKREKRVFFRDLIIISSCLLTMGFILLLIPHPTYLVYI